jgi:hypothetical protein
MLMIKGDPEPGAAPSEELLGAMGSYNDELKEAGVLIGLAGCSQIGHGPGHQHLAALSRSCHPGPDMDRDPGQILTHRLDLPGMQADPELHP